MRLSAVLLTLLVALSACSTGSGTPSEPPSVVTHAVDPGFVHGTDNSDTDRLAATIVTDVQRYWAGAFPATFGKPWRDLDGGFFSVDTTHPAGKPPPCSAGTGDVEGNAFYCAPVDAVAWDRAALLPVLRDHYGEASVIVVLAHELGHAVQQRAGVGLAANQPVLTESMADCYSGSFMRWVADGQSLNLRISNQQLDDAVRALITFRDPIGTTRPDPHGTALDRAAAFQDGYRSGPQVCARMTPQNRRFIAHELTGTDERNRPLDDVLSTENAAIQAYFSDLVYRSGGRWPNPATQRLVDPSERCAPGPVVYCSQPPTLLVDDSALARLNRDIGDQASSTLLASRSALAALSALHRPTAGPSAGWRITCLTGAYTGSRFGRTGNAALSPGDLDEAVEVLLVGDDVARDASGTSSLAGFDRLEAFRAGALGGASACGV